MQPENRDWIRLGKKAGWISSYETELLRFLEEEYGPLSEPEILCVVFCSLFQKAGHTCLPLNLNVVGWLNLLGLDDVKPQEIYHQIDQAMASELPRSSPIIGDENSGKPFVLVDELLAIRRLRTYETELANWLHHKTREAVVPEAGNETIQAILDELFGVSSNEPNWQKTAAVLSLVRSFLIISGGPGTGKTSTVARILALHQRLSKRRLSIALAAPTGKAAGRMGESLKNEMESLGLTGNEMDWIPSDAKTLHRLLSGTRERGLLPPAEKVRLRYDLIIADEASMIDLNLMHRLVTHLAGHTRLILLGDKNQLASVEAGSVFADLCSKPRNLFSGSTVAQLASSGIHESLPAGEVNSLEDSVVYLTKSYRFDENSGIARLAEGVISGFGGPEDVDRIFSGYDDINHTTFSYQKDELTGVTDQVLSKLDSCRGVTDPVLLLKLWKETAWLTVLRRGLTGSQWLNRLVEERIAVQKKYDIRNGWYHGRPVIITQNDYNLGVFNGDIGVCVQDESNELWVYVESGTTIRKLKTERLIFAEPGYFLTVHKSQGSEFGSVNLLLPASDTPVLTKECLYTAITRARKQFKLFGDLSLFSKGCTRATVRYTGLKRWLKGG